MNKKIIVVFLILLIVKSFLNAESLNKIFALKDQEFAEINCKKLYRFKMNKNVIFSAKLSKVDNLDGYQYFSDAASSTNGFYEINFLKPKLDKWLFIEDIYIDKEEDIRYLKFIDKNGFEISLKYGNNHIFIEDKKIEISGRTQIKVQFLNGRVVYYLNNKKIISIKKRFSKLKSINQNFYNYASMENVYTDILVDLHLSEIE